MRFFVMFVTKENKLKKNNRFGKTSQNSRIQNFFLISLRVILSSCGRVCGHYIFLVTGGKYYRFLNMDGERVIQLGQPSIRVTLTSHEVALLTEISDLIRFMLYSDLRTRWPDFLHFPEEIVSKDHLLILLGRKHIYKPKFNIT